jgi:NadR type nicotinamide-nucleotide adenylyltransferase
MKRRIGMVLGKFLPPHKGHLYLVNFARNFVDTLYVVVGTLDSESISGKLRYQWMNALCPNCIVIHLTDENPQDPSEHPDFWDIWKTSLQSILPESPDFVFASESYGYKLADVLQAQFVPVDLGRSNITVSGTAIRENHNKYWQHIPWPVRDYYLKRVCIFGPESCGKTTLAEDLAKSFNTVHVPEFARVYLEEREGQLNKSDLPIIARGQAASEDALACHARAVMFCDTDILTTKIWSEFLFQHTDPWVDVQARTRHYDLYLLCDVDVPWIEDNVRYLPQDRINFLQKCEAELVDLNRQYVKISGSWEQRLEIARDAVYKLLNDDKTL